MPTITSSRIPTPKGWDEFEDIALSAAKLRWESTDFYRNGRTGQKQDGVDIWGHDDDGRHIGVQCKNTINVISLAIIKTEILNAETFKPKLDRLYIATSAKRDGPLQADLREISQQRGQAGKFRVNILFWDDICQDLAKDDDTFFQHYPQFKGSVDPVKDHDKRLFGELTTLLTSDGVIGFLDRTSLAGYSFRLSSLDPLYEFYHVWNTPEREFITPALESVRKSLWDKVDAYVRTVGIETFPTHTPGFQTVPPEWETENPARFQRVVTELHSLAGDIVSLHRDLVRTGRTHLIGGDTERCEEN